VLQVVKFIIDNTGGGKPGAAAVADLPITGGFCDPFTGGSSSSSERRPPAAAGAAAPFQAAGFTDITGVVCFSSYIQCCFLSGCHHTPPAAQTLLPSVLYAASAACSQCSLLLTLAVLLGTCCMLRAATPGCTAGCTAGCTIG
jgi:hypothetical protein